MATEVNYFKSGNFAYECDWQGNTLFGFSVPGSTAFSDAFTLPNHPRSGQVVWPAPEGTKRGAVIHYFDFPSDAEALEDWTLIYRVYVPAGHPDIEVGYAFGNKAVVTAKDQWTTARVMGVPPLVSGSTRTTVFVVNTTGNPIDGTNAYIGGVAAVKGNHPTLEYFDGATDGATWLGAEFKSHSINTSKILEPEIKVEVAWTDNYREPNPVWTDITDYVDGFTTKKGRSNEIGSMDAGTLTLSLDNTGGRFTPEKTTGEFYPNVKPRRQVRVTAIDMAGVSHPLFRGVIERWPVSPSGLSSSVEATATDALTPLAELRLEPPFKYELNKAVPSELFTFNEDGGYMSFSQTPSGSVAHWQVLPTGINPEDVEAKVEWGKQALVPGTEGGLTAAAVTGQAYDPADAGRPRGFIVDGHVPVVPLQNNSFTIAAYVRVDSNIPAVTAGVYDVYPHPVVLNLTHYARGTVTFEAHIAYNIDSDAFVFQVKSWFDPNVTGIPGYYHLENMGFGFAPGSEHTLDEPHFFALQWDHVNNQFHAYMDGNKATISPVGAESGSTYIGDFGLDTARLRAFGIVDEAGVAGGLANGAIQYLTKFDRLLSETEMDDIYSAISGRIGESATERITYMLDQTGWPDGLRHLDDVPSGIERVTWEDGAGVLESAREVADDTLSLFYACNQGEVRLEGREHRPRQHISWRFEHDKGTGPEGGMSVESDVDDIINSVLVDNAFGIKVPARDEASINEFGERTKEVQVRLTDQDEVINQAAFWLRYAESRARVSGFTVNPSASANGALWPFALGAGISERILVDGVADDLPETLDLFIESVRHTVIRDGARLRWEVQCDVSPRAFRVGWVLGDPEFGVLGDSTYLHY